MPDRSRPTHRAHVRVTWLEPDGLFAHCLDGGGHRYVMDARSAVSFSALREGMELDVVAYASGLVRALVWDEPAAPAAP